MAGPCLVFIAYPKAITQMLLPPLLLHFFYDRFWSHFHSLSKGYHTDAVTTVTFTLLFLASSGLIFIAYPKPITQMSLPPLL